MTLGFEVYVGKEDDISGSAVDICVRMIVAAGLTLARGRVLYTDNWYTSMALAIKLMCDYGWAMVGTIVPTDKKSRADKDIPFLKLSNGAKKTLARGWFREAVLELYTSTCKKFYVQCTTWKDKKQVCFLSTNEVGSSHGLSVRRYAKGRRKREHFAAPWAQKHYAKCFNAVDKTDRDGADYSTTIKTNRYYLRIVCWCLDRDGYQLFSTF